ncbi:hypothetical protein QYF36_021347 [Acer negundo]|nr:hypothetical protein QYF36_021347 [Acer negundo]
MVLFFISQKVWGECSKRDINLSASDSVLRDQIGGPVALDKGPVDGDGPCRTHAQEGYDELKICVDLGQLEVCPEKDGWLRGSGKSVHEEGEVPNALFDEANGSVSAEVGVVSSERPSRDEELDQILAVVEKKFVDSVAVEKELVNSVAMEKVDTGLGVFSSVVARSGFYLCLGVCSVLSSWPQ